MSQIVEVTPGSPVEEKFLFPLNVAAKHGGLWSPRPQFESGPGYYIK
jgi:hypothetical protein